MQERILIVIMLGTPPMLHFSSLIAHPQLGQKVKEYLPEDIIFMDIGLCIGCIKHYPGSVVYLETFREFSGFHEEASKHLVGDLTISDGDLVPDMRGAFWAILSDGQYKGAKNLFGVLYPSKHYRNSPLHTFDKEVERQVSSD